MIVYASYLLGSKCTCSLTSIDSFSTFTANIVLNYLLVNLLSQLAIFAEVSTFHNVDLHLMFNTFNHFVHLSIINRFQISTIQSFREQVHLWHSVFKSRLLLLRQIVSVGRKGLKRDRQIVELKDNTKLSDVWSRSRNVNLS